MQNWIKKDSIKYRYIPLFFACLLVVNGLMSILVGAFSYFHDAIVMPESSFLSKLISLSVPFKVNTAVLIILGYLLLLTGRGIYRRQRIFWLVTLIMLFILLSNNLSSHEFSNILTWVYLVEIIILLFCYKIFNQKSNIIRLSYSQFIVMVSFVLAILYGVCGSYVLQDQFDGIKTFVDALYFTIATFSTVGYGDITPQTQEARLFVVSMIFVGLGAFATILTYVVAALVNRIQGLFKTLDKGKVHMKNHVIICGYNTLTQNILSQSDKDTTPFLVIDEKGSDALPQELNETVVKGNATDETVLLKANLLHARSIILAYENDADNILALLTVFELFKAHNLKEVKIITRINQKANVKKAKSLGAQYIISPLVMAANEMIEKAF